MSESIRELVGYSASEVIAMGPRFYAEVFHQGDIAKSLATSALVKLLRDGEQFSDEIRLRHRDGRWIHTLRRTAIFSRDADGEPTAVIGSVMDISNEKSLQLSLGKSVTLFEDSQRVAKIGSWSWDAVNHSSQWSKQMFALHNEDPTLGPPTLERRRSAVHPDDQATWQQGVDTCLLKRQTSRTRFRVVLPTGQTIWVDSLAEPMFDAEGKLIGAQGTSQDVTELVLAEENFKHERAKALQSAKLASLGEMSAGVAHEINNPLTIIHGTVRALPKFVGNEVEFAARLSKIDHSVDRIARIVRGLKKFSRSAEKSDYKMHCLANLVTEAVVLTGAKARQNTTEVSLDLRSNALIWCDEVEIEQVLVNLLNNGIDAVSGQPGNWVSVHVTEDDDEVVLQVRDSGLGIPEKVRVKLFQPFFTTKPVGEGTGLGLSIIKGILDEHKAKIEILTTDPNTCFEIRFTKQASVDHAA